MRDSGQLQQRFWRELPFRSLLLFLAAVFFTFASLGFLIDILSLGRQSLAGLFSLVVFSGTLAVAYGYIAVRRRLWLIPIWVALQLLMSAQLTKWFPSRSEVSPLPLLQTRLTVDVIGTLAAVMLGYGMFMWLIVREGARSVAVRAELDVAREIHQSLVPPIAVAAPQLEGSGISYPSGDVGGDLVDFVELDDGGWVGYVADVSGHGVPAGLLMSMVKAAARAELRRGASLPDLLHTLNRTVLDARKPNMFVTFVAVRCHTSGELELTVAGHLPVLHVPADGGPVTARTVPQIPLGIVEDYGFTSMRATWEQGDLLVLVTDGLSEVFDRADREFGLDGIVSCLDAGRKQPLGQLRADLVARVRAHGPQLDDQTVLFLRRR